MLTIQQQTYNQQVQKDYVEHIQNQKEVEQMATKQKSSKKSQPAVLDEAKESKKSDGFKEQKKIYVEKLIAFAKEEFSELSNIHLRSVLSGAYFAFNEEIKNKK